MTNLRLATWLALAVPAALLAGAFGSQLFGLVPCEMCWWQRWAHVCALVPATAALAVQTSRPASTPGVERANAITRLLVLAAAAAILVSGGIGVYHAGVEYHWWQGHTACTSQIPKGGSTADLLKSIINQPLIRCDVAQWRFIGISLAGWNAILSTAGAAIIAWLATTRRRSA